MPCCISILPGLGTKRGNTECIHVFRLGKRRYHGPRRYWNWRTQRRWRYFGKRYYFCRNQQEHEEGVCKGKTSGQAG